MTSRDVKVGDIVQATPDSGWAACLVIVTELKSFGIQGFTPMPPEGGQAYIRLAFDKFELTGGRVVFVPGDFEEDSQ